MTTSQRLRSAPGVPAALGIVAAIAAAGCGVERVTAVEGPSGAPEAGVVEAGAPEAGAPEVGAPEASAPETGVLEASPAEPTCTIESASCTSSNAACPGFGSMYVLYDNQFNCGGTTANTCGLESAYGCVNPDETVSAVVTSNQAAGNTAVLTYPAVQRNFNNTPVSSLHAVTATFQETNPPVGIHEDTFEIWLDQRTILVMVWVDRIGRSPEGSLVTQTTFDGQSYDVWSLQTSIPKKVTFVSAATIASGTLDLLQVLDFAIAQGLVPAAATLGQIEFGVEIASTGGQTVTFDLDGISILSN
ncbi:MAG: GH12 family glycosyl hydrolase domain-containing protein [Polyangiaceae bacterium]